MFIPNPFIHGDPVPKEHFLGRQKESRRVVSRIISQAQSTAVIGEPRSGKTSLLKYLFDPAMRSALYGTEGERLLFSFVDIQNNLSGTFKRAQFWMQALSPLHARVKKLAPRSPLRIAYKTCMDKKFSAGALESLFEKLRESGQCLVLLLDEFDALLSHPALNNAEFFGGLRSLASRMEALSLVIASRRPLARLNEATQEFNPTGSPFFNFISSEISLGPLEEKDVLQLLSKAKGRFTPEEHHFILEAAGAHPYLLQTAASALWEVYEDGEEDAAQRLETAGRQLYKVTASMLGSSWDFQTPEMRMAVTAIALLQMPALLPTRKFRKKYLLRDLHDFGPELRLLEEQGFVMKSGEDGWQIRPGAFLWWLADELIRTVRANKPFDAWIREKELDGIMTKGEKEKLTQFGKDISALLGEGAGELIKAMIGDGS